MQKLKDQLLTTLRDKNTARDAFRHTSKKLIHILAEEAAMELETETCEIETPITKTEGVRIVEPVVLITILRSGLAMQMVFQEHFESARIGVIDIKRDDQTFKPTVYYKSLPPISEKVRVIILDPMLATGNTLTATLDILKEEHGIAPERILFAGLLISKEGREMIEAKYPGIKIIKAAEDSELNAQKFLVPGIGDFGDRYFGTTP